MARADRKQLVGLLTEDPAERLPEGAQLVDSAAPIEATGTPMPMVGHVTSSYHSPTLGRSIALALVKGGRGRIGRPLWAPLAGGRTIACTVTNPVFYDPQGDRLNA